MSTIIHGYNRQQVRINLPGLTVLLKTSSERELIVYRKDEGPIAIEYEWTSLHRPQRRWQRSFWPLVRRLVWPTLIVQLSGSTSVSGGGMVITGSLYIDSSQRYTMRDVVQDVVVTVPRGVSVKVLAGTISNPQGIPLN